MSFEIVVGLEVHAQLLTQTKLFCGCPTRYGAAPNTQVCPVCLGLPGALPVTNREALRLASIAGLALGSDVRRESRFARKNYFYPDLAKGYQISQFAQPLNEGGRVRFALGEEMFEVGLERIHVEEDAAKNIHGVEGRTVVDFNRGGVPLIEVVSRPELRSAEQAEAYLRSLREVLMFIGVNDGNLEEGSFRCDANVSVRPDLASPLGTRVEVKNINSFRFVRRAIDYEAERQSALIESGGKVVQETRTWDERSERTVSMRGKEEAHDYRYFPDPDLLPLRLDSETLERLRSAMPPLPDELRKEWTADWGLTRYDADVLSNHPAVARYFQATANALVQAMGGERKAEAGKRAANFIQSEVMRDLKTHGLDAALPVSAARLAATLALVESGRISGKIAKELYTLLKDDERTPALLVEERGWAQVSDVGAIEEHVDAVLARSAKQLDAYRDGKTKMLGYFVGQVMQATQGKANPGLVNEILRRRLDEA